MEDNLKTLDSQLKQLGKDLKRLRLALNTVVGYSALDGSEKSEWVGLARAELERATQHFEKEFELFATAVFDRKVEDHDQAA